MTNKEAVKYLKEAIDVINRQETKIEVLKDYSKDLIAEISNLKSSAVISNVMESQRIKREIKAEAYKEFAEKLNDMIINSPSVYPVEKTLAFLNGISHRQLEILEIVDNLVKEMIGDEE